MHGKYFWFRSIASSAIGGFILVAIIIIFGYFGTVTWKLALHMFISIYALELLYACVTAWPAWIVAGYLKIKESIDVYDIDTNFNPFIFK